MIQWLTTVHPLEKILILMVKTIPPQATAPIHGTAYVWCNHATPEWPAATKSPAEDELKRIKLLKACTTKPLIFNHRYNEV